MFTYESLNALVIITRGTLLSSYHYSLTVVLVLVEGHSGRYMNFDKIHSLAKESTNPRNPEFIKENTYFGHKTNIIHKQNTVVEVEMPESQFFRAEVRGSQNRSHLSVVAASEALVFRWVVVG